jgi:hypothetical protein
MGNVGTNFLTRITLDRTFTITFVGLLLVTIASNNFFTTSVRGQIEISGGEGSGAIMKEVSLNNEICDIESESPFSPNALLERLRDEFCDTDSEDEDPAVDYRFIEAESDEDDQGDDDEDDQGNDVDDQRLQFQKKLQELKDRLEMVLSEEEDEDQPLSDEEQNQVEQEDQFAIKEHKSENDKDCRGGNVLEGASNEEDLKVLTACQEAAGEVVHTKKMNDGDYKFLLNVEDKYKYLLNEKNKDKTEGYLVVEIVPPDQGKSGVILPKEGDHVHIWGAWVTDKPKGWHEIHPAWKVINQ